MATIKGKRILAWFVPLVVLWVLLTIFITLNLDHSYDHSQRQVLSPALGHGQHLNPRDVIREKNTLTITKQDRLLNRGRVLPGSKQLLEDRLSSIRNLEKLSHHFESRGHGLSEQHRRGDLPVGKITKRRPQPEDILHKELRLEHDRRQHIVMDPKIYDTQGQAKVCVYRNNETNRCQLHRCGVQGDLTNRSTSEVDDYGFIVHERNTRGAFSRIAGRASAGSGCAISHRYKFVYIHVLKSGGMTIKTLLKRGLCGGVTQTCEDLKIVDCVSAVYSYPKYFVFSFVRNPFSRIYSAYSMALSMPKPGSTPVSFEAFATMNRTLRRDASKTSPSHYVPQTSFLMDFSNCPVVDYVGRLERFRDDMQIIINQIQSPELRDYFAASGGRDLRENCTSFGERKKQRELGGSLQNAYQSQSVIDAVAREFESDFKLFGYDPTVIP